MRNWVSANGGPLALLVLGLGVGGFTNRWAGVALIVIGGAWFLWAHVIHKPQQQRDAAARAAAYENLGQQVTSGLAIRPFLLQQGVPLYMGESGIRGWEEFASTVIKFHAPTRQHEFDTAGQLAAAGKAMNERERWLEYLDAKIDVLKDIRGDFRP